MNLQEVLKVYIDHPSLSSPEPKAMLERILASEFDPEIYYPITYLYLRYAQLNIAKQLLDRCSDKTDLRYLQLEDYYNAIEECDRTNGCSVFSLNVPYRDRWKGSHLGLPNEYEEEPLIDWYPAAVECIEGEDVYLLVGRLREGKPEYYQVELTKEKLNADTELPENLGEDDSRIFIEMGFYGKKEKIFTKVSTTTEWHQPPELAKLRETIWPIVESTRNFIKECQEKFWKREKENDNSVDT